MGRSSDPDGLVCFRGALLQVRELDANGTAVWKPVLVVAVVRAYSSAATVSWRELRKQLPGRTGMRPSWERSGDWTWVAKGNDMKRSAAGCGETVWGWQLISDGGGLDGVTRCV